MSANDLIARFAARYGVTEENFKKMLKGSIFKSRNPSDSEVLTFLHICEKYSLDPVSKEIYPTLTTTGDLLPVVSVDGWLKLLHSQPDFNGLDATYSKEKVDVDFVDRKGKKVIITGPESCRVTIFIKGKEHPVSIEERFDETVRLSEPWRTHPHRMLRHKTLIQAVRYAYSFSDIFDADEAESFAEQRMREMSDDAPQQGKPIAPAVAPREFQSVEDREKEIQKILNSCKKYGVLEQAEEFFKERYTGENLSVAMQRLNEAIAKANPQPEIIESEPTEAIPESAAVGDDELYDKLKNGNESPQSKQTGKQRVEQFVETTIAKCRQAGKQLEEVKEMIAGHPSFKDKLQAKEYALKYLESKW